MTKLKIHADVEEGSLVVGDQDINRSQYNDLGVAKRPSVLHGGSHQSSLYSKHAQTHGTPLPKVAINLQHPSAPKEKTGKTKKSVKLVPTPKEKPAKSVENSFVDVPAELYKESDTGEPNVPPKKVENQYTIKFKLAVGEFSMDVLDVVKSDEKNSILVVFKDEDSVTFKPTPGDVFDITYIAKLGRVTETLKVFSPNLIYTLPDTSRKVMVLVIDPETEED